MTEGFIKLYRILLDDELWQCLKPEFKTIMITLLLMASYKETKWIWKNKKYECKPGEFVTSLDSIKKNCGKYISTRNVRSCLKVLENFGFLTNESTNQNRKICIQNWSKYQNGSKATDKQVTSNRQASDKQVTTIKNDKNVKNVKNVKNIYGEFVKLTEEEHKKLIEQFGESKTNKLISNLNLYIGSKGDKYKSHYHTILMWESKNKGENKNGYTPPKPRTI